MGVRDTDRTTADAPPSPARESADRPLTEGGFRKGIDVLPIVHVDASEAPPMGGLPPTPKDPASAGPSASPLAGEGSE